MSVRVISARLGGGGTSVAGLRGHAASPDGRFKDWMDQMIKGERRATPRIEVLGQLHGRLVSLNLPLVVRELGAGGFSIECAVPFPPGARHQFRFSTPGGVEVILEAAVVHSRPSVTTDGATSCITGFTFCQDSVHDVTRAVDDLLGAVTPALQFR